MKLFENIRTYRNARKLGLSRKVIINNLGMTGWYDHEDVFVAVALFALIAINLTLAYKDEIDKTTLSWQSQALHWHHKALSYEQNIVDMLNGRITINGRERTVCLLNAAGDCETK